MTIHVGIDPNLGQLSYYDDVEKNTVNLGSTVVKFHETEKIYIMFEVIKSKFNGKQLGCACIYLLPDYGNEIRKKFIQEGSNCGFKNVEIISRETAYYLNAMSQIKYIPLNGNVIWIEFRLYFYVWVINDSKAEFIGHWYSPDISKTSKLVKIVDESKLNKGPDVVLHIYKIGITNINKISSACQFSTYKIHPRFKASLLKARITSGDSNLIHLNVLNFLYGKVTINIGDDEIESFKRGHQLPISHNQKLIKKSIEDILGIVNLNTLFTASRPHFTLSYFQAYAGERKIFELPNLFNVSHRHK
jgi:hypothetical protein